MRIKRRDFIELTAVAASAAAIPRLVAAAQTDDLRLTGDSVDPAFGEPFIEVNEERSAPEPHRYVRGGFKGTEGKFSFYFPAKARYQGRFFHNTYPLITSSDAGPSPIDFRINEGDLGFTFASGAYYVQTNQRGGAAAGRGALAAHRLNAAAAKFSRVVAAEIYGPGLRRPYGYLHGGSGGAYQVVGAAELTSGVWDGFLPYVLGSDQALSSITSVVAHARRVLSRRNRFPGIVDALDPGGSGDPYAGLNEEERGALREATLMGFPLRGWFLYQTVGAGGPMAGTASDPTYVEDFWSKPGYLGTDPASSVRDARITVETAIDKMTAGPPAIIELASTPDRDFTGAHFTIISGAAAGTRLPVARISGRTLTLGTIAGIAEVPGAFLPARAPSAQSGDKVRIDNTASLAFHTYHRHFLPDSPEYYAWNQFRGADGKPLYPQRAIRPVASPGFNGHINGKVLLMECLIDIHAWAWQADWYRSKVKQALGPKFEDNFVLWFVDNAQHDVPGHFGTQGLERAAWARSISAVGMLQQGLRDLAMWCEKGVRPPDTHYTVVDTQVRVPATARDRGGVQPVVTLKVNGGVRADVPVNASVKFAATIDVPPNAGKVVAVEWDFEGTGDAQSKESLRTPQSTAHVANEHAYTKAGTYFAVLRVFSQRQGDGGTPYAQIQNIARVRVVVA